MVARTELQSFTQSWNQTAAWAQTQGINRNSYYPIYQMDSARLLGGQAPMSQAERTRAILAAHNPNNVTAVPGDKPDPTNIMGNAVNDLRSIFTGLAPNHLIPNIFDTVKNTILHPATVIKPIGNIIGGLASGNPNEIKTGFEQAAGLEGPGSILSWLPGVYVAGGLAQGGISEVLSHPVVGFLDVAPFAPVGRIIDAAANASRTAEIAAKVGMTSDQLRDASLPGMAKSWMLSRKIGDVPFLKDRAASLVDPKGNPITIGSALDRWITAHTGMGKTLSALMKGMINLNDTGTNYEMAMVRPAELAMRSLTDEQRSEVDALLAKKDPRAQGKTPIEIENDHRIDPSVRTAYAAQERARQWVSDQALASGADVARARPDGSVGIYHTYGEPSPVVKAAQTLQDAQAALVKTMEPGHRLTTEIASWDAQAVSLSQDFGETIPAAEQAADRLDGQERVVVDEEPRKFGRPAKVKAVHLDIRDQVRDLFGNPEGARDVTPDEAGLMGRIQIALDQKNYAGLREYTAIAKRRLDFTNYKLREGRADDPALIKLSGQIDALHSYAAKRMEYERRFLDTFKKGVKGKINRKTGRSEGGMTITTDLRSAFRAYLKARREYGKAVWDHPTADWIDVVKDKFIEKLIEQEGRYDRFGTMTRLLREEGAAKKTIDTLRADPVKMAQLIELETRDVQSSPWGDEIMTEGERREIQKSAIDAANELRAQGHEVVYIPSVSTLDLRDKEPGRYGIHLATSGLVKRSSRGFERTLAHVAQRHDISAGIHQAAKETLQIRATIDFVDRQLTPHFVYADEAMRTIRREFGEEWQRWSTADQNIQDKMVEQIMRRNFNLVKFDPQATFGFSLPRWKPGAIYLPKEIADALPKMLDKGQFPMEGAWNKVTNLFRFSILGLSPRYTAHVAFGGTFLLALRSSPRILEAIPDAVKIMKGEGDVPREAIARGATQRGVDPVVYQSFHDSTRNVANRVYLNRMGSESARWLAQEHIEVKQGIKLAAAQPIHWLKAVGDLNYSFTNTVADFQRAWAYSDFLMGAKRKDLIDPATGEKLDWTDARVRAMAEHHVRKVFGDLSAMTPLERSTFTKLLPFYGWTKHILEFTGSYPVDHPFRASTLTVIATQDSNDMALGLPKRLQFLMFLGSPDVAGNVNALDVRFMDPLRDTANYATIGGWISALNPIISAPIAMIDPSVIFGGVPLYPNVTYDQFYGIETAPAQGNALTAVEQVVPQISALDAALGISAQYRHLAATNPNSFAKAIFESLNVPFAQVQHLNLKQIAAKNELDRYQVAKQAATNAFDSGDFSAISGLSSVPDPLNSQWNVTPGYLQSLYNQLLTEYPGTPPSQTALPPPSAPL
jgi:hypothetical protein